MQSADNFTIADISATPQHNTLSKGSHVCRLQPKVMALLVYLHDNHERVISQEELLEQVWQGRIVSAGSVQKSVNALRSAFAELDAEHEYIHYFSKRGYQLLCAVSKGANQATLSLLSRSAIAWSITALILLAVGGVFIYQRSSPTLPANLPKEYSQGFVSVFNQFQPYLSGVETSLIEPAANSQRAAFVINQPSAQTPASQLFIQSNNGQPWLVSAARGQFVELAWSASGRNLLAIDRYSEQTANASEPVWYDTLHIYTFDFKGEKVIEKNLLSYWQGQINSITWLDETSLELLASPDGKQANQRYHYRIVEQNLSQPGALPVGGTLLASRAHNGQLAVLSHSQHNWQLSLFDARQQLAQQHNFTHPIGTISWLNDGTGVLIVADNNTLQVLTDDGRLVNIGFSPTISASISRARFADNNRSLILSFKGESQPDVEASQQPPAPWLNSAAVIYSALP